MEAFNNNSNAQDYEYLAIPGCGNFEEFYRNTDTLEKNCPGLKQIQRSFNLRRSTNSATIVFLGLSNAGISHTINQILNQNVISVGRPTQEIVECILDMPCNSLKIPNAQIRLIDTPGFGGSYKGFSPLCYPTLVRYFQEQNYLPNYIFLIVNITEKDLEQKSGWFSIHLKKIKSELSEIIDSSSSSNVIVYLTHICSASPAVQDNPSKLIQVVGEMIEETLGVKNVPIVVGENRPEAYDLRRVSDFYVLPSGGLFPRNIYYEMIKQAKSVDPVGHSLISEMLENYGALPTLDIDKSGISTEDNQIIRSPPVHADLIGIDFNPQVPVPLLVDLEEYEPNPETTGSIKATPEDPFEDPFQNLITKADNNSPTEEVLLTNSTAVAEIIDFGDESEESFLEKDLLSEIETKDLHFNEQAVELLDDFEFLLETYAVAAAAKSADENFELNPGIVETVFEATIQKEVRAGNSVPDGCTSKFGSILAQTKSKDIFPDLIGSTPDANNNHAPKGTDTNNNEPSDTPFQEGDQVLTDNEDIPVFEPDEPDHQPEPEPAPLVMYTAIGAGVAGLAMFTHKVYGWLKML